MNYALDSRALIAYFRDEPGADLLENLLSEPDAMFWLHAMNLGEVYYDTYRTSGARIAGPSFCGFYKLTY